MSRKSLLRWLLQWSVWLTCIWNVHTLLATDETKIWEFSPYEVEVWCALDPGLDISEEAKARLLTDLEAELERMFQAAWRPHLSLITREFPSRFSRDLENIEVDQLIGKDLVLVLNKDSAQNALRTFEAVVEKVDGIAITADDRVALDFVLSKQSVAPASSVGKMVEKLQVVEGGSAAIQAGLESKSIAAALVPRFALKSLDNVARSLYSALPGQTENLLRQRDKLMMVYVRRTPQGYGVQAKELDCPMQFMGPTVNRQASHWSHVARTACAAMAAAFAPVARVEDADAKTAELRLKAGGLIVSNDNPAQVRIGDLMQPIIRRDDRNGQAILLKPLSWTYTAITHTDGIKLKANLYSYSGGGGFGSKNRRTQRVVLRVRPQFPETEMLLTTIDSGRPLAACSIYLKDLGNDEYRLLGRTDWRGQFTITVPGKPGTILPESIRAAQAAAQRAAKEAKEKAEAAANDAARPSDGAEVVDDSQAAENPAATTDPTTPASTDKLQQTAPESNASAPSDRESASSAVTPNLLTAEQLDAESIQLRYPLLRLYVKSGDKVIAQLPLVPGLKKLEAAQLSDDTRRLETEAVMRGFQGEILDLIGLRTLLSARIKKLLENNNLPEAEKVLAELRGLSDYAQMANSLERIQVKMLDESNGKISPRAKASIDNLFQNTRDMLQKFLQNNVVRDAEEAVSNRKKAPPPSNN